MNVSPAPHACRHEPPNRPAPFPPRRRGWRVYGYTLVLLTLASLVIEVWRMGILHAIDYGPGLLGLAGLLGYAHHRPVLRRRVWMVHSILLPVWDIVLGAWIYPWLEPSRSGDSTLEYFVLMPLFFPEYLALIFYAYRSKDLWRASLPDDPSRG